jgi:two-component system, NarL family, response regulator NreC
MEVTFGTASTLAAGIQDAAHAMPGALGARCRIVIADDHTLMREGLRALLASEPELQVIGTADNGRDAVRLVVAHKPDLVLMDLAMPHMDGMSAIRELRRRGFKAPVLVITMHKTEEHIRAALQAGASGYLLKDATREEVLAAILAVMAAKTYITPAVADRIVSGYLVQENGGGTTVVRSLSDTLTIREKQVLKLIAEGRRNRDIAGDLYVSVKTVEKHRANLMRKLDLHNTASLTSYAIENALVAR